jgi:GT2 family glycosyltransferase
MLAIVTVVYKNYEVLHDFINSLVCQTSQMYMLYIVDLTDEKERQLIPWIRKIEDKVTYLTGENKGYAHGVNVGIENAAKQGLTRYAVVNPDIIFDTNFVLYATHSLAHHPRTILGAKIFYAPGYEYHTKSKPINAPPYPLTPDTYTIWYAGGNINWDHSTTSHVGVDEMDSGIYNEVVSTDFVSGCCMLFDKTVHDIVGAWDERYFMYYEDTDYCMRAKKKKIKILYDPTIVMWHKNAQSTGGSGSSFHLQHMDQSRLRFGLRHAPLRTKFHLLINYVFSKK